MLQPGQRFKLTRYTVDSILGSQVPTCTQASTESNRQLRIQKSHSGLITIYEFQTGVYAASCVLLAGFLCRIAELYPVSLFVFASFLVYLQCDSCSKWIALPDI